MIALRPPLVALVAVAALALPAAASANEGPPPPPCATGQIPTAVNPCMPPPCPPGAGPTQEQPCLPQQQAPPPPGQPQPQPQGDGNFCPPSCPGPPAPGTQPAGPNGPNGPGLHDGPCGPQKAANEGPTPDAPKCGGQGGGDFMPGFLSRVWRFTADADNYDGATNTLNVTITKILNLPKQFGTQDDQIIDQDADVIFSRTTKVFDAHGKRLKAETAYDGALDDADSVSVVGKFAPHAKWAKDEDGTPVTTIRAKRVTITG